MFDNVNAAVSARLAGVKIASDATGASGKGKPNTITGVTRGEIIFVAFNDARGVDSTAMYFKAGNRLMATKDTVEWCGTKLFPIAPWMVADVERRLADNDPVELPTNDAADVIDAGDSVDVLGT